MEQTEDTTLIGWHGISARVPADWMLAGIGGDRKSGYLRVDYGTMARLQVKWSRRHIDLERKRTEYVKRLATGKRRRPSGLEVSTDVRVVSKRSKPKKDLLTFAWRGAHCGMGVLWNCEVCGRAIIAQVAWPLEEEGRETAQAVLESLEDHSIGSWDTWGVDGLVFLAPEEFQLDGWRRMTRYLELRLLRKQEKLKVARWGMVPLVLQDHSVAEWYQLTNQRRRDVRWQSQAAEIKGHDGVIAWGQKKRLAGNMRTRAARALRQQPVVEFRATAWHCEASNRLYLVEALHGGDDEPMTGAVESIRCHEDE